MSSNHRDWDAEEAALRTQATEAFEVLMGIRKAVTGTRTGKGEARAMYVAEDALESYQKARAALAAFEDERRANDRCRRH